jgi:membrane fusion protein, multidrug efflux system
MSESQSSLADQATRQSSLADQATRQTSLADQATGQTNPKAAQRRGGLTIVALVFIVGVAAYGYYYFAHARYLQETEDAYVGGEIMPVSGEIAGLVSAVNVRETQAVQAGDVLLSIDDSDAQLALGAARAELARAVREVRAAYVGVDEIAAQIRAKRVEQTRARADLARRAGMVEAGAVSAEELAHARAALSAAELAIAALQERRNGLRSQVSGITLAEHPIVLRAANKLREAALMASRTQVRAPVSGMIARKQVQLGARIAPGQVLLSVVPLQSVFVDANFKEGQLGQVFPGQPVKLTSDLYGSSVAFDGVVVGLSAGTGAAFALLPAQNASGNWIKVVQRVPVRIALNREQLQSHPLRVGLSMRASIDVRQSKTEAPQFQPVQLDRAELMRAADAAVSAEIAQIIAANRA